MNDKKCFSSFFVFFLKNDFEKKYILYNDGTKEHNGAIILNYIWEIIKKSFELKNCFYCIYPQGVSKHNGKWNKNLSKMLGIFSIFC